MLRLLCSQMPNAGKELGFLALAKHMFDVVSGLAQLPQLTIQANENAPELPRML